MKTGVLSLAIFLSLLGCASPQTERISGHKLELDKRSGDTVWESQLNNKTTARWHHNYAAVRAVRGSVNFEANGTNANARVGRNFKAGTRITVGRRSGADLYLGENGPVLRMTENSKVQLVRLNMWRRQKETVVDTMIEVESGRVLGYVKPLSPESSYLIKTRGGIIRVRGTEFAISADGSCNVLVGMAEVFGEKERVVVMAGEKFVPGKGIAKLTPQEMQQEGSGYLVASN
jgi:hypothetical protein